MSVPELGLLGTPIGERDRLLRAFVSIASQRGLSAAAPEAVTREAGLAPADFGRHFGDLDQCFLSAWDRLEAIYLTRIALAYEGIEDWRERLRAGLGETLRLIEDHPGPARFLILTTLAAGEAQRARQRQLAANLLERLEEATAGLGLAGPENGPRYVLAMVFDRIYRHLSSDSGGSLSAQLPELMFLAVSAYLGPEAGLEELGVAG